MFIIAKLKLNIAKKKRKPSIPTSADLAASCAILTGPPKAFPNSTSPIITFLATLKVSFV